MTTPVAAPLTPEQITRASGSNFLVSFAFLSAPRRRALTAVYAFCRVVDDAVDENLDPAVAAEHLEFWRRELEGAYKGEPATAVGKGLQVAARTFGVARRHLDAVADGVAMDRDPPDFQELRDLLAYCDKVAGAVGLACLPIFGVEGEAAERYAVELGRALQLTNVLRDLHGDAVRGRIYAPRQWLRDTGVEPEWLAGGGSPSVYDDSGPAHQLVQRLAEQAQAHFRAAADALPASARRRLLPARIMGVVYGDILARLQARGGRITEPRVRLSRMRKAFLALRTWWSVQ